MISGVLGEASSLLGSDAAGLLIPEVAAARLGLGSPSTYGGAYRLIDDAGDLARREFTGIVLALREDERVQGRQLP